MPKRPLPQRATERRIHNFPSPVEIKAWAKENIGRHVRRVFDSIFAVIDGIHILQVDVTVKGEDVGEDRAFEIIYDARDRTADELAEMVERKLCNKRPVSMVLEFTMNDGDDFLDENDFDDVGAAWYGDEWQEMGDTADARFASAVAMHDRQSEKIVQDVHKSLSTAEFIKNLTIEHQTTIAFVLHAPQREEQILAQSPERNKWYRLLLKRRQE